MDSKLFDLDYEVYGNERLFYLNEVVEKVDGSDAGPILKDKHYEMMMKKNRITVLDKTECGNGGTTGVVDYIKRHDTGGLILVPNVSISKGKEEKYKNDLDICCVYGGVDKIDWEAKIVIATYDQFKRLLANLRNFGFSGDIFSNEFWRGRAIFVDEYHKLVDENFRDVMASLTELIINTDLSVALMSATPHEGYVKALREACGDKKEVISITVVYKNRRMTKAMNIYSAKQKDVEGLFKKFISMNQQIYIFYNNVAKITKALNAIGTDDCEILCSSTKEKECGEYYSKSYNPKKKVHFLTSAYFTGHDIDGKVDKVIILGGNSTVANAIGMRDIKQILGRFREYCGDSMSNIHLIYIKEKINDAGLKSIENKLKSTDNLLKAIGNNWAMNPDCIQTKLDNMYSMDALERMYYWGSEEKLIKKLRESGYVVFTKEEDGKRVNKAKVIGELPNYEVEPNMTYKSAYTKVANGEEVSWKEYRDINKIKDYINKYGITRNKNGELLIPTRDKAFNLVKINEVVANRKNMRAFDVMSEDERYAVFGYDDCAVYKASYLMSCLEYIQLECPELLSGKLDYGQLPLYMKEVFGASMFCWKSGNRLSNDQWCVIGNNVIRQLKFTEHIQISGSDIYIRQLPEKCISSVKNPIKISYRSELKNKSFYGRTTEWEQLKMNSLKGISIYDWVNEDKLTRIYKLKMDMSKLDSTLKSWKKKVDSGKKLDEVTEKIYKDLSGKSESELEKWKRAMEKKQDEWGNMKNFRQLQISELYNDTTDEYRHIKSEMNEISCLIIDIDDLLSLFQFKELYKDWAWCAYPTISNTDPNNWKKFRVIIPLEHPVKIEGDNNLKVLKALRSSFCAYEDKCHNLGSYINPHDFCKKYINDGERMLSIEQSDVDLLQHLIAVVSDNTKKKFEKSEIMVDANGSRKWWSLETAIKFYENAHKSPVEGARHVALFKIKNNLSEEECGKFEEWLWEHYPTAVKKHWKTHKRIAS